MIRCNNCGWFNEDHASHCEMCGEPLATESAAAAFPVEPASAESEEVAETETETCPMCGYMVSPTYQACPNCGYLLAAASAADAPAAAPDPDVTELPADPRATLRMVAPQKEAASAQAPMAAATVRFNEAAPPSEAAAAPVLKGTVRDVRFAPADTRKEPAMSARGRATVREIPADLMEDAASDERWSLVPLSSKGGSPISLSPGGIIVIDGKRYLVRKG